MTFTSEEPKYLTVPQTAERLGVSAPRVRRAIRKGQIPALLVGNGYMVREDHLTKLIEEGQP